MVSRLKLGTALAAFVAVAFGLLLSPRITLFFPSLIGAIPSLTSHPWAYSFEELQSTDLRGQSALVTGGNSGIGFEICRALSRQGASVTMACRNPQRCFAAVDKIRTMEGYSGAPMSPLVMDVSDLKSVERAAKTYLHHNNEDPLDMLFLNAGMSHEEPEKGATQLPTSKDGIEKVFATNVVGHHLLYRLMEPVLQKSTMARVVSTSSVASIWWMPPYSLPYYGSDRQSLIPATLEELNEGKPSYIKDRILYGRSKLAQLVWSEALTKRLGDKSNIYVNAAHPGVVHTPFLTKYLWSTMPHFLMNPGIYIERQIFWKAEEGALTLLYLGVASDKIRSKNLRGKYFHPQSVEFDHPHANDEHLQNHTWNLCEELVQSFV